MKKSLYSIIGVLFAFALFFVPNNRVSASVVPDNVVDSDEVTILEIDSNTSQEEIGDLISDAFSSTDNVRVIFEDLLEEETFVEPILSTTPPKSGFSIMNTVIPKPENKIRNVKSIANAANRSITIATSRAEPGIEMNIAQTKMASISASFTGGFNTKSSIISSAVGFSVTKSYSVEVAGKAMTPARHNGKAVKYAVMTAHPYYTRKSFDVYTPSGPNANPTYKKAGSGIAKKPKGLDLTIRYTYK